MCKFLEQGKEFNDWFCQVSNQRIRVFNTHLHNARSITSETTDCLFKIPLAIVSKNTKARFIALLAASHYVEFPALEDVHAKIYQSMIFFKVVTADLCQKCKKKLGVTDFVSEINLRKSTLI